MLSDKIESEKKRVYNLTFDFLSNNNNNNITKSRNLQQVADYTRYSFAIKRKKEKRTECFNNQTSRSQFSENLLTPVNS